MAVGEDAPGVQVTRGDGEYRRPRSRIGDLGMIIACDALIVVLAAGMLMIPGYVMSWHVGPASLVEDLWGRTMGDRFLLTIDVVALMALAYGLALTLLLVHARLGHSRRIRVTPAGLVEQRGVRERLLRWEDIRSVTVPRCSGDVVRVRSADQILRFSSQWVSTAAPRGARGPEWSLVAAIEARRPGLTRRSRWSPWVDTMCVVAVLHALLLIPLARGWPWTMAAPCNAAQDLLSACQWDEADALARTGLDDMPEFKAFHRIRAHALVGQGLVDAAVPESRIAFDDGVGRSDYAHVLELAGRHREALIVSVEAWDKAQVFKHLGAMGRVDDAER